MAVRWRSTVERVAVAIVACVAVACSNDPKKLALRQGSESYLYTISASQMPPHALDSIAYTVVVRDRKTRQPVQNGEGQFYAGHPQGPKTWDGMVYGPEVGTYHGWLWFAVAGKWSVNLRFRRDSLAVMEKSEWMQDVLEQTPYPTSPNPAPPAAAPSPPPAKKIGGAPHIP